MSEPGCTNATKHAKPQQKDRKINVNEFGWNTFQTIKEMIDKDYPGSSLSNSDVLAFVHARLKRLEKLEALF